MVVGALVVVFVVVVVVVVGSGAHAVLSHFLPGTCITMESSVVIGEFRSNPAKVFRYSSEFKIVGVSGTDDPFALKSLEMCVVILTNVSLQIDL